MRGLAHFRIEKFAEAAAALRKSAASQTEELGIDYLFLAQSLAHTGELKQAASEANVGQQWVKQHRTNHSGYQDLQKQTMQLLEGAKAKTPSPTAR